MDWTVGDRYRVAVVGSRTFEGEFITLDFDSETQTTWYTFKVDTGLVGQQPTERRVNSMHVVFVDVLRS